MLNLNRIKDAVLVLESNTQLFPKSANAYDSLGEAYMKNSNKERAMENYQKSLELDPRNENAKEMLKRLR